MADIDRICPSCGNVLRPMCSCKYHTAEETLYCNIYHCENCHDDWETAGPTEDSITPLTKKFWG
jgi:hypothetical protein